MSQNKMREKVAEAFIEALSEGEIPWEATWKNGNPQNAVSGKAYRGLNSLWLSFSAMRKGYKDPRWCTFKQAKDKGWNVKKGEKSSFVEFWSFYDKKTRKAIDFREANRILAQEPERKDDLVLMSRVYSVFNGEQIEGIPEFDLKNDVNIDMVRSKRDVLLSNMGVSFREGGNSAYYVPSSDSITMPLETLFDDTYGYMATLLHECAHATGHENRLKRDMGGSFGSEKYAKEELRAEIASAFTVQALNMGEGCLGAEYRMDNHKAYIQSWIKSIKDKPTELFAAIKDAEGISDYLLEKGEFVLDKRREETICDRKLSLDTQIGEAVKDTTISSRLEVGRESDVTYTL